MQLLWKAEWEYLRKLGVNLPKDPAISLLVIYPRDAQSSYNSICSTMIIIELFAIAKPENNLLMEEWIKKL